MAKLSMIGGYHVVCASYCALCVNRCALHYWDVQEIVHLYYYTSA